MTTEVETGILHRKKRLAKRLFESEKDRQRVFFMYERTLKNIPDTADTALVLGTSFKLFPDKFRKRVFTAVMLQREGRVKHILFSGDSDSECKDENQSLRARRMATDDFGIDQSVIWEVGGNNTMENITMARSMLRRRQNVRSLFIVSDERHLLRALPVAAYEFGKIGVSVYPKPIEGDKLDINDPSVRLEIIKVILYNRILNRTEKQPSEGERHFLDSIANHYTHEIGKTSGSNQMTFDEWKNRYFREQN